MERQMDLSKEYGLVLEGGGAKGAYQIGAWQALREEGVKIRGISGVSVGALNGALICMDDPDKAREIWENISYSQVMDVDDAKMDSIVRGDLKNINLNEVVQDGLKLIREKGMDVTPLKNLIARVCDEEVIRNSPIDLYIVTYSLSDHQLLDINVKDVPDGLIGDMLLASAYLPTFKREPLHGKRYIDGGVQDRVPLDSLIKRGYHDIIVLRIYGFGVEKRIKIPEDVQVTDIAPRKNLGGVLEFDSARSRRNMKLGYYDAKRVIYGLAGSEYYLDMKLSEEAAYERLINMAIRYDRWAENNPEKAAEMPASLRQDEETVSRLRRVNEVILPGAGRRLCHTKDWTYSGLYIALLEQTAIALRISRYRIYTEEELLHKIKVKKESYEDTERVLPIWAFFFE